MNILLINGKTFNNVNIRKLDEASKLFRENRKMKGMKYSFDLVSNNDLLSDFFLFINGETSEIPEDNWIEIIDIANEWQCEQSILDSIYSNVIIHLNNCDKSFIDKSAVQLPRLIKYLPFSLLPTSVISNLFESRFACLPSQNELVKFVVRFFKVIGTSAVYFVHYIDPKYLQAPEIIELNQTFEKFDCSYLFPEFKFNVPLSRDLRNLTIQCEAAKREKIEKREKRKKLEQLRSERAASEKDSEAEIKEKISEAKEKLERQNEMNDSLSKVIKYAEDSDAYISSYTGELDRLNKEIERLEKEVVKNNIFIQKNNEDIQNYCNEEKNFLNEYESLEKENNINAKIIEDNDNNLKKFREVCEKHDIKFD